MTVVTSIFWVLGLILSVVIAPQLRIWTWGPAMLCFSIATFTALPQIWKERKNTGDLLVVLGGFALVGWLYLRAGTSPVAELAQSDALLLSMAVATFVSFRTLIGNSLPQHLLVAGVSLLFLASLVVIGLQIADPVYSPIFPNDEPQAPAGFFAHYSYGAAFLIPASLILGAIAIHGRIHAGIRIWLFLLFLAGAAAVYFTKSRGGWIGMGAGTGVLALLSILVGGREKKKWFVPAILLLPFLLMGIAYLFLNGLGKVQESRIGSSDMTTLLDGNIRLYLLGIAGSCIGLHPFVGGGSRSYSWECFQFWDTQTMGRGFLKPEHVHNELIQTFSDYGFIGGVLVIVMLMTVTILGVFRIISRDTLPKGTYTDAWRIGGLAGLAGLFTQSNFEGILRLPPGAVLLGLCIAAASLPAISARSHEAPRAWFRSILASSLALPAAALLLFFGWKGSLVTQKIWSVYFAEVPMGPESKADRLTHAISIWPLYSLMQQRAINYQTLAANRGKEDDAKDFLKLALADYEQAAAKHQYNPEFPVARGNILSALQRDNEAEEQFRFAIQKQGEMEAAFRANQFLAIHLQRKGLRQYDPKNPIEALNSFQLAKKHIENIDAIYDVYYGGTEYFRLRVNVICNYGKALEAAGEYQDSLAAYDEAAGLPEGNSANYRAGLLLGKRAVEVWSQRRGSAALRLFMEAEQRVSATNVLPDEVIPELKDKYLAYLRKTVAYLQGAKIQPSSKLEL
ncbi:O-antigen ligase family protein [Luteolibacter algae]|uniref:O-antigen ligase family protein n=1 Tax=Luteolibacter algae TaxID=454151 RepID=A0ABW5D460_9BACT